MPRFEPWNLSWSTSHEGAENHILHIGRTAVLLPDFYTYQHPGEVPGDKRDITGFGIGAPDMVCSCHEQKQTPHSAGPGRKGKACYRRALQTYPASHVHIPYPGLPGPGAHSSYMGEDRHMALTNFCIGAKTEL